MTPNENPLGGGIRAGYFDRRRGSGGGSADQGCSLVAARPERFITFQKTILPRKTNARRCAAFHGRKLRDRSKRGIAHERAPRPKALRAHKRQNRNRSISLRENPRFADVANRQIESPAVHATKRRGFCVHPLGVCRLHGIPHHNTRAPEVQAGLGAEIQMQQTYEGCRDNLAGASVYSESRQL